MEDYAFQKELDAIPQESGTVCHERTNCNIADTDGDDDLKAYLGEKVSCVDFEISHAR